MIIKKTCILNLISGRLFITTLSPATLLVAAGAGEDEGVKIAARILDIKYRRSTKKKYQMRKCLESRH